jgi:hypothetical protein
MGFGSWNKILMLSISFWHFFLQSGIWYYGLKKRRQNVSAQPNLSEPKIILPFSSNLCYRCFFKVGSSDYNKNQSSENFGI